MPVQAERTLRSLATPYQRDVRASDYEVVVVENASDEPLGEEAALRHGPQFRYFHREETAPTPVHALNFGVERARAPLVAVMIDGARMVTPGVAWHLLRASRLAEVPLIAVPGYHLGDTVQQEAVDSGYDEEVEAELLRRIDWPENGYDLFDIACFSASTGRGFFRPFSESNCLAMPRRLFDEIGGFDPAFDLPGGGNANLDLYRRACEHPDTELVVIPGEGSFHQFHGGVTTNRSKDDPERRAAMEALKAQYRELRGEEYSPPRATPLVFGRIPPQAQRFVRWSAESAMP